MESFIIFIAVALFAVWLISLVLNLHYFFTSKSTQVDAVFFNKSRSFDEAFEDLRGLEKLMSKQFNAVRNKIAFYENNAILTGRKYNYYSGKVEDGFIKIYLHQFNTKREVFNKLDLPVKNHFKLVIGFVVLIIAMISIGFAISLIDDFSVVQFLIGSILVAACVRFYILIVSINMLFFYLIVNFILYAFKIDCSKLYKNTGILHFLTSNWNNFHAGGGTVIGASAIGALHSYSGDGFGGYGGGSFGGGGAGGSW
tara:strand:- start:206 stop:970 length:765 start_codon:yes stop_codon:yes gene_type:complete